MQLSEKDKLERDIFQLRRIRATAEEEISRFEGSRRAVARWIVQRMTYLTIEIDRKTAEVQQERDRAEIRMRTGGRHNDLSGMGEDDGENDGAGDPAAAGCDRGRDEENDEQKRERAGSKGGGRDQLVEVGPVRRVAARENAGGGSGERTAEECLRRRHRERRDGLRDWQTEIMEADEAGRHERMTL